MMRKKRVLYESFQNNHSAHFYKFQKKFFHSTQLNIPQKDKLFFRLVRHNLGPIQIFQPLQYQRMN